MADLRRAIALWEGSATLTLEARYRLAHCHALLADLAAEADSGLAPAEAGACSDRAVDVLEQVVAAGFRARDEHRARFRPLAPPA